MTTATQTQQAKLNNVHIHHRHGQDLCILGQPRSVCRNRNQKRGWDQMRAYLDGYQKCVRQTQNPNCPELADWAAELQTRRDEAWDRRAWAKMLNVQTAEVMAAMEADAAATLDDVAAIDCTCAICGKPAHDAFSRSRIGTDTYAHDACLEDEADKAMYDAPGYAESRRW